ncbi:MAG: metal-dependent transcriptional regulator [Christensenellales bacterium]|jgi:DtxR family Mn-dependent transcriptional regulator
MKKSAKAEFHTVRGYQLLDQDKSLTPSMEDYLEMIYRHSKTEGFMRINTLAELLHVKASSATKMVQKLGELNLIDYERYGIIVLTDSGKSVGCYLLKRHLTVEKFLKIIGIDNNILLETELIEHNISKDTLRKISAMVSFFEENPEVLAAYKEYLKECYKK